MSRRKRRRPHGMGSVYQRGPGNFWIKWRQAGEARYSRGYAIREPAEQVLAKIVADMAAGRAGLPPDPKGIPALSELMERWLGRRQHTHRAWRDDLNRWKRHLGQGGAGLLFTPAQPSRGGREGRPPTFLQIHTLHRHVKEALARCAVPSLTWYQATRHTFASQFVLKGGSIEKLSKLMGHSSVTTTERYAHLRTDLFRVEDYDRFAVDLRSGIADVVPLKPASEVHPGTVGYVAATQPSEVSPAAIASL